MASPADIAIYGGAAGGGKSFALLLEPLRHIDNPGFGAVFFRRTTVQIRNEGGLWDESVKLYAETGATPKEFTLTWRFPSGATISFAHMEHEKNKFNWQGAQIPLLCFDELTHFSESQFFYMLSRNRSMCGVRPYVRATCNPDPDSWVAKFISWWIDQETGYPIPERAGKLRYFVRVGDTMIWADHPRELAKYKMPDGMPIPAKSVTFIPALLTDNKALMMKDPGYMANLLSLSTVERERLLGGNWKIRRSGGFFDRTWFPIFETVPGRLKKVVRGWDLAGTEEEENAGAAFTAGVCIGELEDGRYIVLDVRRDRLSPLGVERLVGATAQRDKNTYGALVTGSIPQDPGQSGKFQAGYLIKKLAGLSYRASPESGDKGTRALPLVAQAEVGNILILEAPWNEAYLAELEAFPQGKYKDQVDASSRALMELTRARLSMLEVL